MTWFEIEAWFGSTSNTVVSFIRAKTYEDAELKFAKHVHATSYKLLGKWEPLEIDKNMMRRIA